MGARWGKARRAIVYCATYFPILFALGLVVFALGRIVGFDSGGFIPVVIVVILALSAADRLYPRAIRQTPIRGWLAPKPSAPGSAVVGYRYLFRGHLYRAAGGDAAGVRFVPQPAPEDREVYDPISLTHAEIADHFQTGELLTVDDEG